MLFALVQSFFALRNKNECNRNLVIYLLSVIAFGMLCSIATASGRLNFGMESALASRYTPMSLLILSALVALRGLTASELLPLQLWLNRGFGILLLVTFLFLPVSELELELAQDRSAISKTASIAMLMNVNDMDIYSKIFPAPVYIPKFFRIMDKHKLSIFRDGPLPLDKAITNFYSIDQVNHCIGHIDSIAPVKDQTGVLRLSGWSWLEDKHKLPSRIALVDGSSHYLVGWASNGWLTTNMANKSLVGNSRSGWSGYAKDRNGMVLQAFAIDDDDNSACRFFTSR